MIYKAEYGKKRIYKKRNTIEIVDWLQKQLTIKDHSSKVTLINLLDNNYINKILK